MNAPAVPVAPAVPLSGEAFLDGLTQLGVRFVAGVPCSYFTWPLQLLAAGVPGLPYAAAVNEGSALALAAGARLGGGHAAVIAQNSGFGNLINPLTSLLLPYRIPVLVAMSMRGWPQATAGEPQHRWMGQVVPTWLDSLDIPHWMVGPGLAAFDDILPAVAEALAERRTPFILIAKGAIDPGPDPAPTEVISDDRPTRSATVAALLAEVTDQRILASTGYLSRELFNQGDRPENFYLQGSMGHVGAVALGAALSAPAHRFVILDGDGALLMHAGSMATLGHFRPGNLTHIVFDNGSYESTGAQPTAAAHTDMAALARAYGYIEASDVDTVAALRPAIRKALESQTATLVVVHGRPDVVPGGRASESLAPDDMADRFCRTLQVPPILDGTGQ